MNSLPSPAGRKRARLGRTFSAAFRIGRGIKCADHAVFRVVVLEDAT